MKQASSIELFRYWNRLRRGRVSPRRSDVEPADIRALLSDTFILEQGARGEAVFRLAGTRLCSTYGRELKATPFSSLWRPRDQRLAAKMARSVFGASSLVLIDYQAISDKGHACPFELLLLPLDGGEHSPRCLGIASACSQPFWLGSEPVILNHLDSVRVIDPDREPVFLANRPAVAVPQLVPRADDLAPRAVAGQPAGRKVGHLLVFDGGRAGAG